MEHIFWVDEGLVGGRPGPNLIPWDLPELKKNGVHAILSVNDGALVYSDELAALDIDYCCAPLSENAPPRVGDLEICQGNLPVGFAFVARHRKLGQRTIVHCRQGRDRTGLFLAYYFVKQLGMTPEIALERVRTFRRDALAADGWGVFALQVLRSC